MRNFTKFIHYIITFFLCFSLYSSLLLAQPFRETIEEELTEENAQLYEEMTKDIAKFGESHFRTNTLFEMSEPLNPEFTVLVDKYSKKDISKDTLIFSLDMLRTRLILEAYTFIEAFKKEIEPKNPNFLEAWTLFNETPLSKLLYKNDFQFLFLENFMAHTFETLMSNQRVLGYFLSAPEGHLTEDQLHDLNLLQLKSGYLLRKINKLNEISGNMIHMDNLKKQIKENRIKGQDKYKEDAAATTIKYQWFYQPMLESALRMHEQAYYVILGAKEAMYWPGIAVYPNMQHPVDHSYRDKMVEESAQDVTAVRKAFIDYAGFSVLGDDSEFSKLELESWWQFKLNYLFFPVVELSTIITSPLQIPQDIYAYYISKKHGVDPVDGYLKLVEENPSVAKGRKWFLVGEGVAGLIVAVYATGGLAGGWREIGKRTAMIFAPSIGLSATVAGGQAYFDIGDIKEKEKHLKEEDKTFTYGPYFKQFLEHTGEGTAHNLLFVGGLGVFSKFLKAAKYTPSQVINRIAGVDLVEASADPANTGMMFENSKNGYQYFGSSLVAFGNIFDSFDGVVALTKAGKIKSVPLEFTKELEEAIASVKAEMAAEKSNPNMDVLNTESTEIKETKEQPAVQKSKTKKKKAKKNEKK